MPREIAAFTTPVLGGPKDPDELRGHFNAIREFANDHHAAHWPVSLSPPKIGATGGVAVVAATGGVLAGGQSHHARFTFVTPNGETARSAEASVSLGGGQNALTVTVPAADARFTPGLYAYKVLGAAGTAAYRCRLSDLLLVSGAGAAIAADGRITLSTTEPTVFQVLDDPPNTQPVAPLTGNVSGIDPLRMLAIPHGRTRVIAANTPVSGQTTVTETHTFPGGNVVEVGIYDDGLGRLLTTSGHEIRIGGLTVARYNYTYEAITGNCTAVSLVEA